MNTIMNFLFHVLQITVRILAALALLAIALFCSFGFLASFEPGNGFLWKAGYAALGCGCMTGAFVLFRGPSRWRTKAAGTIIASAGLFFLAVLLLRLGGRNKFPPP
jgi:hypothetical protein